MTRVLVATLLAAVPLVAVPGWWWRPGPRSPSAAWPVAATALLALGAGVAVLLAGTVTSDLGVAAVRAWAVLAAVAGGGPLTELVLRLADPGDPLGRGAAADLLRGGAWIGALERAGVSAALVLGSAEAVAIVLAVKGLGRYPELRAPAHQAGVAERFIVGTLVSVLWAAACAGVAHLVTAA